MVNGLELSEAFFNTYGRPMLEEQFPGLLQFLAVGLAGSGSECLGYDDEISRDHDFEPGFCIFLPGEDIVSRREAFLLERAYAGLPKVFEGLRRLDRTPVGGARHGVLRTEDFFLEKTGSPIGLLTMQQWLSLPEQSLLEATNGKIFFDNFGQVVSIRKALSYYPEDIRRKKLAGSLLLMAQAGQYNYPRCLRHQEPAAAQLALYEFVRASVNVIFLLNRRYQPYYKWSFRALRELPELSGLEKLLAALLSQKTLNKAAAIEEIAEVLSRELAAQNLSAEKSAELELCAYSVNDHIQDPVLRNMHILAAI